MKKFIVMAVIVMAAGNLQAQFTKATLQASGLTCAMCSNAINKSLEVLPFIETVKSDIKNSAFNIQFKQNADVDIDALQKAVDDAGFSVAGLKLTGNFDGVTVNNDQHTKIGDEVFHFLEIGSQELSGEQTITIVDKKFVTSKDFKKYSSATKMACLQTGMAADCCQQDGISANTRIYHVTL